MMPKRGSRNNLVEQVEERAKEPRQVHEVEVISSGCDVLDFALGGGFPLGCVINLVGDTGSGKTLLTTEFLVRAINKYKDRCVWLYDDVESRYSFNTYHIYKTILSPENFRSSRTVEDFNYNFTKFIRTIGPEQFGIYIVDCLDMMSSKASMKRSEAEFRAMDSGKTFDEGISGTS
jgi:predicted ATP-dependent serine protease